MAKLLICDKDGTLVKPKSGGEFVRRPEDEACAKAAGIPFQWAHEFFGGVSDGE